MDINSLVFGPRDYKGHVTETGLVLKARRKGKEDCFLEWSHVKNLWPRFGGGVLAVVDVDGHMMTVEMSYDEGTRSEDVLHELWRAWGETLRGRIKMDTFEHPAWFRNQERRLHTRVILQCLFLTIVMGGIAARLYFTGGYQDSARQAVTILTGAVVAGFFLTTSVVLAFGLRRPQINRLRIDGRTLSIEYADGRHVAVSDGIRKQNLTSAGVPKHLVFDDGIRMDNLERLDFWPVLWARLLDVLHLHEERETA